MATSENAIHGIWTDRSVHRRQILVTDYSATVIKSIVAVCLTLSGKYIAKILTRTWIWIQLRWDRGWNRESSSERAPLLTSGNDDARTQEPVSVNGDVANLPPRRTGEVVASLYEQDPGGRDILARITRHVFRKDGEHKTWSVVLAFTVLAVFVSQIVAGVFSAKVATDRAALWSSDHCGVWEFDSEGAGEGAATRADTFERVKEARAGDYAQNCYADSDILDPTRCDFFYKPNISFTTSYTFDCPFPESSVCVRGVPAVTFDTGPIDAGDIGINAKRPYKFRRRTSCTPLSTEYPYVRNETINGTTAYYYRYATRADIGQDYMYTTIGNPFDWPAPAYNVRVYPTTLDPDDDEWIPIPELTPPANSTLTVVFVSAMRIFYPRPSEDPIFPADKARYAENGELPWYYKSDPKARALACIDSQEFCSPDEQECWFPSDARKDTSFPSHYWLMKLSLEYSDTFNSIIRRLGTALIAQEKLAGFTSQQLDGDHWIAEAKRIFATSLAWIQFAAWSISSGEDRAHEGADGYKLQTPDEAGDLCGLYKFKSAESTNIDLGALIGLLFVLPSLWFLSTETRTVERCCGCWKRRNENQERRQQSVSESLRERTEENTTDSRAEQSDHGDSRADENAGLDGQHAQANGSVDISSRHSHRAGKRTGYVEWEPLVVHSIIGGVVWVVTFFGGLFGWLMWELLQILVRKCRGNRSNSREINV